LFFGDVKDLTYGIQILSRELKFEVSPDGTRIKVEKSSENKLEIIKNSKECIIKYLKPIHFFRALGLFMEAIQGNNEFHIVEEPQFITNGVMFDISQGNAVINVENVKNILNKMSLMGLNMLMLYSEDSFEIKDEPYFGYMRGKYSFTELKELDDYAYSLGIEMIPCIQTLAHLVDALKWECYWNMRDDDDTLLVGEERTYEFIEKMIASAAGPFRTKRIHIGMDEAWKLGQGEYLLKNGYRRKFDIMNEHLERVMKIVNKYGLEPIIWSDMYFRAASETGNYYDTDSIIPKDVIDKMPSGLQLAYWDYENQNENTYTKIIKKHKEFGSKPIFAGGIWSWNSYTVDYAKTFATTNPALTACKKEGIDEVFTTVWGDCGCESNVFSNLLGMQLFAEHGYSRELNIDKLKRRFKFCTGGNYDDFFKITYLDRLPETEPEEGWKYTNPSKYLMWQDILSGLFDKNIENMELSKYYSTLEEKMRKALPSNGEFGFIFEFLEKVCAVLSIKSEIGLKIKSAYDQENKNALKNIADIELAQLAKKVEDLRLYHLKLWMKTNKPLGWEILDIRYGGVQARINTAVFRISEYLNGKISSIDELEEERLYFGGEPGFTECNLYWKMPSASRLSSIM